MILPVTTPSPGVTPRKKLFKKFSLPINFANVEGLYLESVLLITGNQFWRQLEHNFMNIGRFSNGHWKIDK